MAVERGVIVSRSDTNKMLAEVNCRVLLGGNGEEKGRIEKEREPRSVNTEAASIVM